MSKQDRQGARTVTDLERKYNFGASFAEVYKLIDDVQVDSEKALEELDKKLTPEEIFNRLTGYKTYQGVFRGADGNLYVNAEIIKGGTIESGVLKVDAASITGLLTASQIDAQDLKVAVANVTGLMEAGKIKSTFLEVAQANISGKLTAGVIDVSSVINAGGLVIKGDLGGYATESDLKNGNTTINGGCITTGTIDLARLNLKNNYGSLVMANGSTGADGTIGAALTGPTPSIYLIVTDAGCRIQAGSNSVTVTATDARIKVDGREFMVDEEGVHYNGHQICDANGLVASGLVAKFG